MRDWSVLASPPVTWADSDAMSALQALLVFGGGTVGIVAVICFLVVAPSLVRGASQRPSADRWSEPFWFGGPTGALDEAGSTPPAAPAGHASGGGAGARW